MNSTFHVAAAEFVQMLIRQRRYLIASGQSKADPGFINSCLWELEKYLDAYQYDTDLKMARFWIQHSQEIAALIPGRRSPVHEITILNFTVLSRMARAIAMDTNVLLPLPAFSFN